MRGFRTAKPIIRDPARICMLNALCANLFEYEELFPLIQQPVAITSERPSCINSDHSGQHEPDLESMSAEIATSAANPDRVRLHITPFNAGLLDRFIAPTIRPLVGNISYHTVQTQPERGFGYVEMPKSEAEKLKKKLNGSTLKGSKVRIEEARPEKKRKAERDETEEERQVRKKARKEKRKEEQGVLAGHEMEQGRHVKRGWTEDDSTKKGPKKERTSKQGVSGSTEGKKLRFKTSVPPNAAPVEEKAKGKSKDKKSNTDRVGKKQVVVQEFAKSSKPSARPSTEAAATGQAARYEDGEGWVDEDGTVVEAEPPSRKRKRTTRDDDLGTLDEASKDVGPSLDQTRDENAQQSSADDDWENGGLQPVRPPSQQNGSAVDPSQSQASSSSDGDDTDQPSPTITAPIAEEVHPLEALFKRPTPKPEETTKPKPAPIDTSFSFFGAGSADADEDEVDRPPEYPPQTPRTREDLESRSLRSAAPTPDTAAIGKRFSFPFAQDDDGGEDGDEDVQMGGDGGGEDAEEVTPVPAGTVVKSTVSAERSHL